MIYKGQWLNCACWSAAGGWCPQWLSLELLQQVDRVVTWWRWWGAFACEGAPSSLQTKCWIFHQLSDALYVYVLLFGLLFLVWMTFWTTGSSPGLPVHPGSTAFCVQGVRYCLLASLCVCLWAVSGWWNSPSGMNEVSVIIDAPAALGDATVLGWRRGYGLDHKHPICIPPHTYGGLRVGLCIWAVGGMRSSHRENTHTPRQDQSHNLQAVIGPRSPPHCCNHQFNRGKVF